MAYKKISDLTALATTPDDGDLFEVVDVSDTTDAITGTNKKVTRVIANPLATAAIYGRSKLSTAPASASAPIAVGDNDTRVPSQGENDALTGTSGTPSSTNKYVTNDDTSATSSASKVIRADGSGKLASGFYDISNMPTPFIVQDIPYYVGATAASGALFCTSNVTGTNIFTVKNIDANNFQVDRYTKDANSKNYYLTHTLNVGGTGNAAAGCCVIGTYLYISTSKYANDTNKKLIRVLAADLTDTTLITFSGTAYAGQAFSDETNLYVYQTTNVFTKYTISGTVATNAGDITYTSGGAPEGCIGNSSNVWIGNGAGTGTYDIRKYALTGGDVVSTTSPLVMSDAFGGVAPFLFLGQTAMLGIGYDKVISSDSAVIGNAVHLEAITLP